MSEIFTGNFSLDLTPGVQEYWGLSRPKWAPIYSQFFDVTKTTERFKRYVLGVGLGIGAVKEEGDAGTFDTAEQGWNVVAEQVVYSLGFRITREAMEDGHTLDLAQELTMSCREGMATAKEIVATQILNYATDSGHLGGDGKVLLATDHPLFAGGTYSNTLASQAVLSEASLESLLILARLFPDERGIPMAAVRDVALMVHPSNRFNAKRALGGTERPATSDRDINAMHALGQVQYAPIENPFLTNTNSFFIKTDVPKGLICLDRRPLELQTQNVQNTQVAEYLATERYTMLFNDPRGVVGGQL